MSEVGKILEAGRQTVEIGGVKFICRKLDTLMSLRVHGSKTFGMIEGAKGGEATRQQQADIIALYLTHGMISPKIGEATNEEADTITVEDLGPYALPLVEAITGSKADVEGFTKSSTVQTAET